MRLPTLVLALLLLEGTLAYGEETIFSGPQPGEKLTPFSVRGVYDEAGKELNFVAQAGDRPIVLVFLHDLTRPSAGFTRALMDYAASRKKDGLASAVVWLDDDLTAAEQTLNRVRHALPKVPLGISLDGKEGPGSYGLNRQVTLTVLVAKEGKVTGNFALVQPSIPQDLPKVLASIVDVVGGTVPQLSDLPGAMPARPARGEGGPSAELAGLLRALIQKNATPEEVAEAAKKLEEHVAAQEADRRELTRIARTIVNGGKLENYGTPAAQNVLRTWAK